MFDHVTIRVSELAAAQRFYDLAFEALEFQGRPYVSEELLEWNDFSLMPTDDEHPVTRRLHAGFVAPSRAHVDAFWSVLTAAGYRDDGPPGPQPQYRDDYYGSFVLDPDGNSAEAVHHGILRDDGGLIDHLWLRVRDVEAAKRFYETIGGVCGFVLRKDDPDWVGFRQRWLVLVRRRRAADGERPPRICRRGQRRGGRVPPSCARGRVSR